VTVAGRSGLRPSASAVERRMWVEVGGRRAFAGSARYRNRRPGRLVT
jgi:hypothetical protein